MKEALDIADKQPKGTIFIIPVKLEPCSVPRRLKKRQWVDLFDKRGEEKLKTDLRSAGKAVSAS